MKKNSFEIVSVDANVILRLILTDNEALSGEAKKIFEGGRSGKYKIYIDEVVLAECVWVLTRFYKKKREEISQVLSKILSFEYMANPSGEWVKESLSIYKATNLSFADCWLMVLSKNQGFKMETFDLKLKKVATR